MKSKLTVGVTGGIGSGKSYICKILENMGYPVFYADQSAKSLLSKNPTLISKIKDLLGEDAYHHNNTINRKYIANQIFGDDSKLAAINNLVHPVVREAFSDFVNVQDSSVVFNEAAIIFETGSYKQFDKTILVTAPLETKVKRILKRDATTIPEIETRMEKQWSDERKISLADYTVNNDSEVMLLPQIIDIISSLEKINKLK
ncbi:MAG: dephospho-CoA kinase [Crocinitomicaceae bacterium]